MRRRNYFYLLLCLGALYLSGARGLAGWGAITVSLPMQNGDAGSSVVIPVTTGEVTGRNIIAFDGEISFDPTVLQPQTTPVSIAGTLSSGLTVTPNAGTPGRLVR